MQTPDKVNEGEIVINDSSLESKDFKKIRLNNQVVSHQNSTSHSYHGGVNVSMNENQNYKRSSKNSR